MTLTQKFINSLPQLDPITFAGVAKTLGVKLLDENGEPRDFSDVLADVLEKFDKKPRQFKKELIWMVKHNASNPKNS